MNFLFWILIFLRIIKGLLPWIIGFGCTLFIISLIKQPIPDKFLIPAFLFNFIFLSLFMKNFWSNKSNKEK